MSLDLSTRLPLSDGNSIPCFGFGCYNAYGEEITNAVAWALEAGYRYLDSASFYKNEAEVGKAIKGSRVPREELFVLSKIWPSQYDDAERALTDTLKALGVDYLDCYMIHWPTTDKSRRLKTYEQLLKLKERGLCRIVAASNFLPAHIEEIHDNFGHYLSLDELEINPYFQEREVRKYLKSKNIQAISYAPLSKGGFLSDPTVAAVASNHGKKPNQAILRWHIQNGLIPIPKSSKHDRIIENCSVFDFELTQEEMATLDSLECGKKKSADPMIYNG